MLCMMMAMIEEPDQRTRFRRIYQKHHEVMCACARQCTLQFPHLAEDILQEVWLHILPRVNQLSAMTEAGARAYLLSAVRNTAITMQQKEARTQSSQIPLQTLPEESLPDRTDVLDEVCALDTCRRLAQAIRSLTDETREVIYLYYLSSMSLREIAEFLHLPYDTVRKRFQRGKTRLMQKLEEGDIPNENDEST